MKRHICSAVLTAAAVFAAIPPSKASAESTEPTIHDWDYGYARPWTDSEGVGIVYQQMAEDFRNLRFDIRFPKSAGVPYEDVQQAVLTYFQYDPELFYICSDMLAQQSANGDTVIEMKLLIPGTAEPQPVNEETVARLRECKKALDDKADAILAGMPPTADTDYAKSLYLHDYVATHTRYEFSVNASGRKTQDDQTAYGALVMEKAICNGFANAYALLLRRAGIPAWIITGFTGGDGHTWVLQWMDGDCVYTDPTWDNSWTFPTNHSFFALSLEEMSLTHNPPSDCYLRNLPACGHSGHTYISKGDVNSNGTVSISDAVLLSRLLSEDSAAVLTQPGLENADMNSDQQLSASDLSVLLRKLSQGNRNPR